MKILATLICLSAAPLLSAQTFSYPVLKPKCAILADAVPARWKIIQSASGDLNKDRIPDHAVVLEYADSIEFVPDVTLPDNETVARPRILAIYFGSTQHELNLVEQNNVFILCHNNPKMNDPFNGVAVKKGILSIDFTFWYSMGSWWTTNFSYKFRYQDNEFKLIGFDEINLHRGTSETAVYSVNFLTRKLSVTTGDAENLAAKKLGEKYKDKTEWKTFKLNALKTFRTLKRPKTWDLGDNVVI